MYEVAIKIVFWLLLTIAWGFAAIFMLAAMIRVVKAFQHADTMRSLKRQLEVTLARRAVEEAKKGDG